MIRTWKMLGLPAFLYAALATAPAPAGQIDGPEQPGKDTISKQLADLQKTLDAIQKRFEKLENDGITTNVAIQALTVDINKLKERLQALEKGMPPRISGSAPTTGSVELVNEYTQPMDFIVNQVLYRLRPGETRLVSNLPLGPFTFRVLDVAGYQNTQRRVLTDDKPYIIRVHPIR